MLNVDYLFFCIVAGLKVVGGGIFLDWGWRFFWLLFYVKKKQNRLTNRSSCNQCSHGRGKHHRAFINDCFPPERSGVQTPSAVAPHRHLG